MKHIAILGNSHVAALALAWREVAPGNRPAQLTFYAAPRDQLESLRSEAGVLVTDDLKARDSIAISSSGSGSIDLSQIDEVWLVGLGLGVRSTFAIYKDFVSDRMRADNRRSGLSTAAFLTSLTGGLRRSSLVRLINKVREVTDAPIYAIREPFPSTAIYDSTDLALAVYQRARVSGDIPELRRLYEQANLAACGAPTTIVSQPDETVGEDGFSTLPEFCEGSVKLTTGLIMQHRQTDVFHMNSRFGALTIEKGLLRHAQPVRA